MTNNTNLEQIVLPQSLSAIGPNAFAGCSNLKTVIFPNSLNSIYESAFANCSSLKFINIPASISTINIIDQRNITDFKIENDNYSNIRKLRVENSNLNTNALLAACCDATGKFTVERVRLTGIEWGTAEEPLENADFIKSTFPQYDGEVFIGGLRGIDENDNNLDKAYLVGTCYIRELTGEDYAAIKSNYPYLDIKYGTMTSTVTFRYQDETGEAQAKTIEIVGENSAKGEITEELLAELNLTPALPTENAAFTYEFDSWSYADPPQTSNGINDHEDDYVAFKRADALINIAGDRTLYPVFKAIRKKYRVTFENTTDPNFRPYVIEVPYGSDAVYVGPTPVRGDVLNNSLYEFTTWYPGTTNITSNRVCRAQFALQDNIWWEAQASELEGISKNYPDMTFSIYLNQSNSAVKIPNEFVLDDTQSYNVLGLGFIGYSDGQQYKHPNLELATSVKCTR